MVAPLVLLSAPAWTEEARSTVYRSPVVRFAAGAGLGFAGPGAALQDALMAVPDVRSKPRPVNVLHTIAVEARVPGTRRLWLRGQRTAGRVGLGAVEFLHPGPFDFPSQRLAAQMESLGLLTTFDGGWWRGGLGVSRNRLWFDPCTPCAERRLGALGDLRVRALGRHRASRAHLYLDVGAQYNATGSVRVPEGLAGHGLEQRAGPFSFSHASASVELGFEL